MAGAHPRIDRLGVRLPRVPPASDPEEDAPASPSASVWPGFGPHGLRTPPDRVFPPDPTTGTGRGPHRFPPRIAPSLHVPTPERVLVLTSPALLRPQKPKPRSGVFRSGIHRDLEPMGRSETGSFL